MAKRRALIIAPRYDGVFVPDLAGGPFLVPRLKKCLEERGKYEVDVLTDTVTMPAFRTKLSEFFDVQGAELLFYFYGHGCVNPLKKGVFATSGGRRGSEGVLMSEVIDAAGSSPANEVVMIFDCCHAGASLAANSESVNSIQRPTKDNRIILAACAEHQSSWEAKNEEEQKMGIFSAHVLLGLEGAAGGEVSGALLGDYITKLKSWKQTPIFYTSGVSSRCIITSGFSKERPGQNEGELDIEWLNKYLSRVQDDWIKEARKNLEETMSALPESFLNSAGGPAIDVLCDDLKKIRVPFVGTLLSNMVKKAAGFGIRNTLDQLQYMQQSDDDFLRGLSTMGEDVDRLDTVIQTIVRELLHTRERSTVPKPVISDPYYAPHYPLSDNELQFGLLNVGGGAISVPEIELITEGWEPETAVNYTVPQAPPLILRLKVELSPRKSLYPLLKLNDEPRPRFFRAYSEGAEFVCIQMSSETNARYKVRIKIPYTDMTTGTNGTLVYPPSGESPLDVRFPYSPGWDKKVTLNNMLARDKILDDIIITFKKVTMVLENEKTTEDFEQIRLINQKVREAGFPMGIFPGVLTSFAQPIAEMARPEGRTDVLAAVLKLAHQLMRYTPGHLPFKDLEVREMANTKHKPALLDEIRLFFTEINELRRQQLLDSILATL